MTKYKLNIKKDDKVLVIAGRDRGKVGKVLTVFPDRDSLLIEKVNMIKRHTRGDPNKGIQGGIIEKEAPLYISNVKLICVKCTKATRVKRMKMDNKSVRVCKKCGSQIP